MEGTEKTIRRADAIANKTRVLEAARQVFAEQGLDAEIKDVALCAGVGVATIYRGFGSKNDLIEATVSQVMEELNAIVAAAAAEIDPESALRGLLTDLARFVAANGWLVQALLSERLQHKPIVRDEFHGVITNILDRGIALHLFRADLPYETVLFLIEGVMITLAIRPDITQEGARLSAGLVDLLTNPAASP